MLAMAWAWFKGSKIAMWGAAAVAAILAVLGILARERAKGREQERQKQDQAALETVKTVEQVSRDVEGQTEAEQRKGLEGWARD